MIIAVFTLLQAPIGFADDRANTEALSFGLDMCGATAKLVSGYAFWFGGAQQITNSDNVTHPENIGLNSKRLYQLNEKSKDNIYEQINNSVNSQNITAQVKSYLKTMGDLLIAKADEDAVSNPGMSRTYYERNLKAYCFETTLGTKFSN